MKASRDIMGMPVTASIVGGTSDDLEAVFDHFRAVDERFSPFKDDSELSRMNRGELSPRALSDDMREVLALAEQTKRETRGAFNARRPSGFLDPSGVVKGWAIRRAAALVGARGYEHFYIDAGGDIQLSGCNDDGAPWTIGIRNPFQPDTIVRRICPGTCGVATSGTYLRGTHIYDPEEPTRPLDRIVSVTVVGPDACEADRFATAAFVMQQHGAAFVENLPGFEAYQIDASGTATATSGFGAFVV